MHLKKLLFSCIVWSAFFYQAYAQYHYVYGKLQISYDPRLETYFIAERLVAENIGNYVFSNKTFDYSGQPIVMAAFNRFKNYKDSAVILKLSALLDTLKPLLQDNAPIIEMLLYKKQFPAKGNQYPFKKLMLFDASSHPKVIGLIEDVIENLREFYIKAQVSDFLMTNEYFYRGAVKEVEKLVNKDLYTYMENYYGEHFLQYNIVVAPTMTLFSDTDSYRGIGPTITTHAGKISCMILSTSVMLEKQQQPSGYTHFGFDNPAIIRRLCVHEIGHSFINPHVEKYKQQIESNGSLFTPALAALMGQQGITSWYICVIENLVRAEEIRIAEQMKDTAQANWLRQLYVHDQNCIFIPALEEKMVLYEKNRRMYPTFENFIPELLTVFNGTNPEKVDQMLGKTKAGESLKQ
jgi:hypothetical protein